MQTFIAIIVGVLLSIILYSLTLLISKDRMISIMISALAPVIVLLMTLILVDFSLVDLNVVFTGTIIGIVLNGLLNLLLKNRFA